MPGVVPVSVKRLIVSIDPKSVNVSEFCVAHGVSRWFFYDLRRRYEVEGDSVFEPRSRAPKRVANKTGADIEERIIELRKQLIDQGWDGGPVSIRQHLIDEIDASWVPSESTIWRILSYRGFIVAEPKKRPRPASLRFQRDRANELWQIDGTIWPLPGHGSVKVINIIDDASRTLIASRAHRSESFAAAWDTFCHGADSWGLPQQVLSDNAHGFTTLDVPLSHLGIHKIESRPGHPQTAGKVERFHQTLKRWLNARPAAEHLDDLQALLDTFTHRYNTERKHRAIGRITPTQKWDELPKSGPSDTPITTRSNVHTSTADSGGRITAGSQTRITLGSKHAYEEAVTIINSRTAHVFINGKLVRAISIQPDKNDYPLYRDNL